MYKPDKPIIDNRNLLLYKELNKILEEQYNLDIATAYFNIEGFNIVQENLTKVKKFRLLLGVEPQYGQQKPDYFDPHLVYKRNIKADLENHEFEKSTKKTVLSLLSFLNRPEVEVRMFKKDFLHGKAYIFDKLAIVGSSNFTLAGLTSNTELNAVLDEAHCRYLRDEWFNILWKDSEEYKADLIKVFDESKFGTKPYTPYQVFIKSLYELQKEEIQYSDAEASKENEEVQSEVNLANFQQDAVRRIYSKLRHYNGVLIADSVGLGKTWIAKKVIEEFGYFRRKRFLVVCPASVDDTVWRPELRSLGLSENIIHHEELGREDFGVEEIQRRLSFKLEDVTLIVVDESHNFRNPLSNRYEKLYTLIERASIKNSVKVLLLTATPMNNSHWDLYFQLMLIARNNERAMIKDGIFELKKQFRLADRGLTTAVSDVLQQIAIRRTRQYIQENYPDAQYKTESGVWIKIKFPARQLHEIEYNLDETYQGLYHDISNKIENELTLAYYKLEEYKTKGEKDEMQIGRMIALSGIFQTILLKRLESSVEAFRKSIDTQIKFLRLFKDIYEQGKIIKKDVYNKYISLLEDEENSADTLIEKLGNNLIDIDLSHYNSKQFLEDLEKDIATFEIIKKQISTITTHKDAKLQQLKQYLLNINSNNKILLFSFYADTIDYLYTSLTQDNEFVKKLQSKISSVSGRYSNSQRREIVNSFLTSTDTNLLLSTDILSEGQNLQQANMVINYDLHWNPVRMIQRAGRIDRIGSPHEQINIYNFFPERELESLLALVRTLQRKIAVINDTVGLDSSVLGEQINPKVFGIIRALKGDQKEKQKVMEELEKEQFGGGEAFWQPLKNFGLEKLKEFCDDIPDGIQSGLKRNIRGMYFYYKYADDFHLWYLYDLTKNRILTTKSEILGFISCPESESRIIPQDIDEFTIHQKILEHVREFFSSGLVSTEIRTAHGRMEPILTNLRDELEHIKTEYSEGDNQSINKIDHILTSLRDISFTKKRLQAIRKSWKNYQSSENWIKLIESLYAFISDIPRQNHKENFKFDESKLKLVCVDYIS